MGENCEIFWPKMSVPFQKREQTFSGVLGITSSAKRFQN